MHGCRGRKLTVDCFFCKKLFANCSSLSNGKSKTEINELKLLMEYNMNNAKLSTLQLSDLNKKLGEDGSWCNDGPFGIFSILGILKEI